ncbi:hypothetical protein SeMB42_g03848 [Synchytrium endobioticum]|uniref:Uncharacterized protein n=1 Tax=Synchytrium endobioticum TaxID=286115 RepID=A0A507D373_9FUNG|nr:hypothetical protein SeMB42_g03848 [Synchytrium endobioticum]
MVTMRPSHAKQTSTVQSCEGALKSPIPIFQKDYSVSSRWEYNVIWRRGDHKGLLSSCIHEYVCVEHGNQTHNDPTVTSKLTFASA